MTKKRKIRGFRGLMTTVALAGILTACSTAEPSLSPLSMTFLEGVPSAHQLLQEVPAFAGQRPSLVSEKEIYQLSAAQQAHFLDYYNNPRNQKTLGHKRLVKYLIASGAAFNYDPATRTADEVFEMSGGNCLSLANVTTALARLVGVRVSYQLRDDIPVYEMQDDIILRGVHVRSVLYKPLPSLENRNAMPILTITNNASKIVVDYFPTGRSRYIRRISEPEFTAMYYRNLAAEALARRDLSKSYWFTKESMVHAPNSAHAVNMMAVLYRRSGDEAAAEQIYLYGLKNADEKLSLLKNYRVLLKDQGRTAEADEMTQRIAKYNEADPFEWWFLAEDAYAEAQYSDALAYYQRSVDIAPYLHEGYFGLAKTYFQMGRLKSAKSAMQHAAENAARPRFKALYEAKLKALSNQ